MTAAVLRDREQESRIRSAGAGDVDAQDWFCRSNWRPVRRWFLRRWRYSPLRAMVGDALQEVFIECCRPGGALAHFDAERGSDLAAYLRGIARRVAQRIERREAQFASHYERRDAAMPGFASPSREPCEDLVVGMTHDVVRDAVGLLEREPAVGAHSLGELVVLLFREGRPARAIARLWGVEPRVIYEQRRRACRLLRRLLVRRMRP